MKTNKLLKNLLLILALVGGLNYAKAQTYTNEALSVTWSMASGSTSTAVASPAVEPKPAAKNSPAPPAASMAV